VGHGSAKASGNYQASGATLWSTLPDPVAVSRALSFDDADPSDLAVVVPLLQHATQRLAERLQDPPR
jgi:hypothetical protein